MNRNIGVSILLTIVTCGIYGIYWFVKITDEAGELSGDTSMTGGMALLFSIITCGLYTIYWGYKIGKVMQEAQIRRRGVGNDQSVLYLILAIFGLSIIVNALVQSDINDLLV